MFFYDPDGQLIGEYKDNASTATPTDDWLVRQETIWLEDIPVAVIRKSTATGPIQVYYVHTDHLNTPRVIVNTANTIVWRWENTHAFGANLPDEDPDGNAQLFEYNPRFPGQYFDKETNLHYNYFRYYEPETGRYVSPDPIGLAGGLNIFSYASADPLSYSDPYGLFELPVLSQSFVDTTAGFGDGVYKAITLGLGDLQDIRNALGINGGINKCSNEYEMSSATGNVVGAAALGGALVNKSFKPGGWLNNNRYLRIGWGKNEGHRIFRISGHLVKTKSGHIDIWRGSRL